MGEFGNIGVAASTTPVVKEKAGKDILYTVSKWTGKLNILMLQISK